MTFILQRFRARLRFFPVWQQSLAIGGLLLNDRILTAALHFILGVPTPAVLSWGAPLVGMLLWVPVFAILDSLRLGTWRRR
jgi:rod shape-determining protein MreD